MKRNFLVVAANTLIREALVHDLELKGFSVSRAADGAEADQIAGTVSLDAVVVESHLPDMSLEELRSKIKAARPECHVVDLTSFELVRNTPELLRFGTKDYLLGSDQIFELLDAAHGDRVSEEAAPQARRGIEALTEVIDVLVGLLELDDRFFGGSSHQAMRLARAVAEEMSADEDTVREVVLATLLRDTGKVDVDAEVLRARGTFSDDQKTRMKEHVAASTRLFEHIDLPWRVLPIIRHHHEHYDGTGYPDALSGRRIPVGSRIISVVDAYVALTSNRQHREAIDAEHALQELIRQAGRQFDPEVVEAFQKVLDKRLLERTGNRKPRVLIYDSQSDFRKLIKMRLLNEGYDVKEARHYRDLGKKMRKYSPDLVLCDADSDLNAAFELLREVREDDALCRIPSSFLSRQSDRVTKLRALREGVDDFLSKDAEIEELVVRVENTLTRESMRRDGSAKRARRGIQGDLENLSLPDIVQTLVMGMKTACVTLNSDDRNGVIWFENGAAKHAQTDGLAGEEAFFEMVQWLAGEFIIEHGRECEESSLQQDAMFLLMEGLRLLDESRQAATAPN